MYVITRNNNYDKGITKPEKPVKELLILFRSRGSKNCAWRS